MVSMPRHDISNVGKLILPKKLSGFVFRNMVKPNLCLEMASRILMSDFPCLSKKRTILFCEFIDA